VFVNFVLSYESREETFKLYKEGKLKPLVDAKEWKGLDQVPDAIDYMLSGKSIGKVVVKIA
jgi:NADPH-dependent curcumin reductase CurA